MCVLSLENLLKRRSLSASCACNCLNIIFTDNMRELHQRRAGNPHGAREPRGGTPVIG